MYNFQDPELANLASMMKRGRFQEIHEFFSRTSEKIESETFVSYVDKLIAKSGMKRAQIIEQVGLSKDYMYKVLRGAKTTTERDYIIAICISMKANILETQKLLSLYPFPELDRNDERSYIIMAAINDNMSIYDLDGILEEMGHPLIKVSPDMPSAKVGPSRSTVSSDNMVHSKTDEEHESSQLRRLIEMEKTNTFVIAEHFGNAPFDFFYLGEFELTSETGKHIYAQAEFWPDGSSLFAIAPHSAQETIDRDDLSEEANIEEYATLEDARGSAYFSYFYELDKLTDQKAAETIGAIDDTKNYGFRMGGQFSNHGLMMYAEAYNAQHPELNEYIQVRQIPGGYIYSASHKSYFMQMELGDFYEPYFGKADKQLFLFEVSSIDDLGAYSYYTDSFKIMVANMNAAASKMIGEDM